MKEMLITNDDNTQTKCYAVYYSSQGRYYIIYTDKSVDEKGYVIIHLAKVLKVVNRNEDNVVIPTGAYVGMEVTDQLEWNTVKTDIQTVIANLQGDDSVTVQYLPLDDIKGIVIKSSKTFRLSEEIVKIIIKEDEVPAVEELKIEEPAVVAPVEPEVAAPVEEPVVETPVVAAPTVDVPSIPSVDDEMPMPAVAPNPFEFQPLPTVDINPEPVEPKPVNPYEVLQQQRDEEMIKNLASDNMQDISPVTVLSVDELEKTQEVVPNTNVQPAIETPTVVAPVVEPIVETPTVVTPVSETPVQVTPVDDVKVETVGGQSFVDSIVADVSDILDDKSVAAPKTNDDGEDYKQLYHDELEKTVELEKELKELHNKLNNIKNIVE